MAPIGWDVQVERAPRPTRAAPQRAVATAQASELLLPGGMGAVSVRMRGCAAEPRSEAQPTGMLASLGVLLALAGVRRRS
jgi:MYXO-CTERM domain-containing protein